MKVFSVLFDESESDSIIYKDKELICIDKIPIENNFIAEIDLISTNSKLRQAISFCTKGKIDVGDGLVGPQHIFWEELWTEMNLGPIRIEGKSKDGIFMIWNSWDWDGCVESWTMNGAMIKEKVSKTEFIYHCNDGEVDDDFDDIVFRLKFIAGLKGQEEQD